MNDNKETGNQEVIQGLKSAEMLYVLISGCTREPYVVCDPETFDDGIYMFFTPEDAKAKAEELQEAKIPVGIAKLENSQMLMFYTSLHTMGVNSLVIRSGEEDRRVQLSEFVRRDGPAPGEGGAMWVENPELHLTALYYMQELRRDPGQQENPQLKEWQEEISNYFSKGSFIIPVQKEGNGIPVIKLNDEEVYQAVFTDIMAFQKFKGENQLEPLAIPAEKLPEMLVSEASGVLLNPMGVRMPLQIRKPEA